MPTAAELIDVDEPSWPEIVALVQRASAPAEIVPAPEAARHAAIESLQVTVRSYLGALAANCGAISVDHGWLRLLGAGTGGLGSIGQVTAQLAPPEGGFLVVALDVLGSRFAVNGGGLPAEPGEVCFWGVDAMAWYGIGVTHSGFVEAALTGGLDEFYGPLRWPGWADEVAALAIDQGLSVYPFPFTAEGQDLAAASRTPVPMTELLGLYDELARQIAAGSPTD
jgi:hypothetical protein